MNHLAKVDYLNVGLMGLSCLFAFYFPFELFLLAYAILGPLHYLTEISWLHDRDYFISSKRDAVLLYLASIVAFLPLVFPEMYIKQWHFSVFFLALLLLTVQGLLAKLFIFGCLLAFGHLLLDQHHLFLFFAFLIPTVVHVFIFTGLFMFRGWQTSRRRSSLVALATYVLCTLIFIVVVPEAEAYQTSTFFKSEIASMSFYLHKPLLQFFNLPIELKWEIQSMRFIAFAYTYHYLNWFSKTKIIQWNQIGKTRKVAIVTIYGLLLIGYAINYQLGLILAFLLSILHVYLEFPLNFRTLKLAFR